MSRHTVFIFGLALLVLAILFGLACAVALATPGVFSVATPVTIDVNLPSDSTGVPGGTLAVRILVSAAAGDTRYADGAPILIFVPGGTDAGTLRPVLRDAEDVIRIVFLFPGGTDPLLGRSSDGAYDYRGPNSIAALRDVIRYAAGELTDAAGNTIDDVVPVPVLHDNIGLLGGSNGGNIVVAVAGEHGAALRGHLRYIIQWESPVSSQIATVDLGGVRLECEPGQRASLSTVNPRYQSYGPLTLGVDYAQLAYDAGDPRHRVFFDGTGDGRYTTVLDPRNGCRTPDLDLDGTLSLNEDFPLSSFTDGVTQYYSRPVTQALADQSVFGGSWPADVGTPAQAKAFWDLREAVRQYPAALANIPDLEGMVLASVVDHVQTAPDHPHIRQALDGWDGNGAWVKINPDRDYVLEVDPSLSSRTDLPDNAANTAPADWTDAGAYAYPEGLEEVYFAAAVHEMADRAQAAATPTPTVTSIATATATPTATLTPTATPIAGGGTPVKAGEVSLNGLHGWPADVGNHLKIFDVALDETRNRVYVQGILTSGMAVIDGATDTLIGSLESGIGNDSFHRTYLAVHPTTGALFVADYHSSTLRRLDPDTGAITGPVALSGAPTHILIDATANRVYLSLENVDKLAVYDAGTLGLIAEVDLSPARPGGMALDSAGQRLYVADARPPGGAGVSRLMLINTSTLAILTPVTFTNTTGRPTNFVDRDPASGRLFVTTPEDLLILSAAGAVQQVVSLPDNAKAPIYWATTGKVYIVSRNGISPIRSSVSVVDAATGSLERTVDLETGGAQRAALNRVTGKLYTPGMEYTDVAVFDTSTNTLAGHVDIGNAVEDIAVAPDGTAYFANRLGGSTVIAYDPDTGAWNEFEAGGWPTAVDVDPTLNRLYVLSHFAGTVSAFDLSTDSLSPTLLAAVPLGLADTTDAISNQVVDATHHRVITAHPAHDRIVVVDGENLSVAATVNDVPSFAYDPQNTAGRGYLQPAVDEGLNKLYVFASRGRKVDVFDGANDYAYLRTIDLSGQPWDDTFNDFLTWADSARHRLYVGLNIIDTTTDTVLGQLPIGAGQVVAGVDETANRLYTIGAEPAAVAQVQGPAAGRRVKTPAGNVQSAGLGQAQDRDATLYVLDRDTYAVRSQTALRALEYVPPYVAVDVDHGRFYAGYMQRAEVDIYTLDGGTDTATPTATPSPTATPTAPPASQCVRDVNGNGVGDVADIQATASDLPCRLYLPMVVANWRRPWPTPTATPTATPTPTSMPGGTHGVSPNWGPEYQVSNTGGYSAGAVGRTLAVDSQNRLHVVWTEQTGSAFDVYYARSIDGGQTWTAGRDIANSPLPATGPNIAVGPDDTLHVIWHDRRRLPDGRVRLYFVCDKDRGAIASAVSGDGLSFTLEDGFRLERAVDPNVLHLADDTYWMFYATSPEGQRVVPPQQIYTARSSDGLNWTVEGEVLAAGGPYDSHAVADPSAIELPSGDYRVYYGGDGYVLSAISSTSTPTPTPTPSPTPTPTTSTLPLAWQLEPGLRVSGEVYGDTMPHTPLAPDVIQLDDGRYRMFYSVPAQGVGSAISSDGFNWTVESGLRLESRRVEGELHFDVGHPTVVRLADGRWRMYVQSSTGLHTPLRVASAVSTDGFNFIMEEGIRIDIGPDSEYSFAGHGRAWRAADGSFWMLFSANTHDDTGPSDIALTTSSDGLTWTTVEPHLFVDGHDPTLLVNADGSVTALWMYLDQTFYTSDSADGLNWSTPVEVLFYDEDGQQLIQSPDNNLGDVALLRSDDGSLRLFTNWRDGIRSLIPIDSPTPTPTLTPTPTQSPYLLTFHACDTTATDCRDPRNHRVYLAQSDDGADWSLIPGWEPYQGSVPDVIRRGDTLYIYTPARVRRYRFSTDTWEDPGQVTLTDPEATGGYVDPSLFVDDQGRLVLFYLLGIIGQNPAGCAPEETTCVKHFHSAVEVEGSDGTAFVAESGDRVQITISPSNPSIAADPDIFYDGGRYVLYISRGASVQLYTSPTLHGSYVLSDSLPDGYLTRAGGVPAGHFDPATARYWTYVHTNEGVIRRAVHDSLATSLSDGDFTTVLSGNSIGLGESYRVESPGFAVNTTATPTPPPASQCVSDTNSNGIGDVADIMAVASDLPCQVYLPVIAANWRQPWPTATPTPTPTSSPSVEQLPINLVYGAVGQRVALRVPFVLGGSELPTALDRGDGAVAGRPAHRVAGRAGPIRHDATADEPLTLRHQALHQARQDDLASHCGHESDGRQNERADHLADGADG